MAIGSEGFPWLRNIIANSFQLQVGNGAKLMFWHDNWLKYGYAHLHGLVGMW